VSNEPAGRRELPEHVKQKRALEATTVRTDLAFNWCRRAVTGGTAALAILTITSLARAQTINRDGLPVPETGPARLQLQIADTGAGPGDFADLAEKVAPAVIAISAKTGATLEALPNRRRGPANESPSPDTPEQGQKPGGLELVSMGAGFFISPDGYAVTNSHIVEDSDVAEIRTSDHKPYSAKVIGRDSLSDLALIKIEGRDDFAYVRPSDQPRVGDWVLAVGNSFGLGGSVMAGIVSARERNLEAGSSEDFLQIDAPMGRLPEQSSSPIVNRR
jgi:serine protease Do